MSDVVTKSGTSHFARELEAKIIRADQLRRARERKALFVSEDQERTAHNLHKVISDYRESGRLDVHALLQRVGLAGDGATDSTKRLDTYTLPRDASESRRRRLRKTPGKYFQFAEMISAMVGEPEAVVLSRIFEGCSYGTEYAPEGDWDSENWARLTQLINLMAESVIRVHELDKYWRKVRLLNGQYDVLEGVIRNSADSLGSLYLGDKEYGLAGIPIHHDDVPPIPSILLGKKRLAPAIKGWIDFQDGNSLEVSFTLWLEAHLALGPVNDPDSIGPLLESRTIVTAQDGEGETITFFNPHTDIGNEDVHYAKLNGEIRTVGGLRLEEYELRPEPFPEFRGEHYYFGWQEISPALLKQLLEPSEADTSKVFLPRNLTPIWKKDVPANRFSKGSAAASIHTDLLTGKLEEELGERCDALARLVEEHHERCAAEIRKAEASAMARWAASQRKSSKDSENTP